MEKGGREQVEDTNKNVFIIKQAVGNGERNIMIKGKRKNRQMI